jgi:uncharacterized membrane protein
MSWYEFLLFAHIAMATTWVGGAAIIQFFGLRAMRATDPMRLADLGADIEWIGQRVLIPSSLLAVVSGVLLVIDSEVWGFGDDWIVIGIVLFAITFLAGAGFFGPESGRLGKLVEREGPTSPAVLAKLKRLLALTRADLMLLFLIIFDMSVKPSWGDGSFWIAVLVFAAVAALLVRNGLNAQLGATPSASAVTPPAR